MNKKDDNKKRLTNSEKGPDVFSPIIHRSLKDQIYDYLRQQIQNGQLGQGKVINIDQTSSLLGVSRTPLRDALLQLECEGLVTVTPRRGVIVRPLEHKDIKNFYQVIGALEATALIAAGDHLEPSDISRMKEINVRMRQNLSKGKFDAVMSANLEFHSIYLNLCENEMIQEIIERLRKRLHGFIPGALYIPEWEEQSIVEHERLVEIIEHESLLAAANYIRDVHWSYLAQKKFILQYYSTNG